MNTGAAFSGPLGRPTVRFVAVSEDTSRLWALIAFGAVMGLAQAGVIAVVVAAIKAVLS